jgi:hypothetical protein
MGCCAKVISQQNKTKSTSPDQGLTIAGRCGCRERDRHTQKNDPAGNEMQNVNQEVCKDKDIVKLRRVPI